MSGSVHFDALSGIHSQRILTFAMNRTIIAIAALAALLLARPADSSQISDSNACYCQAIAFPMAEGLCDCTFYTTLPQVTNAVCAPLPECEAPSFAGCELVFADAGYDCEGTENDVSYGEVTFEADCGTSLRMKATCPINPSAWTGYVLTCDFCAPQE